MNISTKEMRKIILESLDNDPASAMQLKMKWRTEDLQQSLSEMRNLHKEMVSPETARISKSYYARKVGSLYEKIKKTSSRLMKIARENLALYEEMKNSNSELLEDSAQDGPTTSFLLEFIKQLSEEARKEFIIEISDIMEEKSPGIQNKINENFGDAELKLENVAKEIKRTRNKLMALTSEQREEILSMVEE